MFAAGTACGQRSEPTGALVYFLKMDNVQYASIELAVIKARTSYKKPDGSMGAGWYTDDWQLGPQGWRCVSAHVSRS